MAVPFEAVTTGNSKRSLVLAHRLVKTPCKLCRTRESNPAPARRPTSCESCPSPSRTHEEIDEGQALKVRHVIITNSCVQPVIGPLLMPEIFCKLEDALLFFDVVIRLAAHVRCTPQSCHHCRLPLLLAALPGGGDEAPPLGSAQRGAHLAGGARRRRAAEVAAAAASA
eukprot:CAMPEP_0115174748 /NCGR_PEP_ID=MMETSP0270-20121206/3999_1 /TAXON_ID=71861 /ORGANISM="Scrippsiella trochoidea, Strain CCMP3099" /LENGTH=168 /DNA_ID=CAMNT_0002587597 /DNA_START=103 /DNA_END=609 /DNA_ORIENTATION=-